MSRMEVNSEKRSAGVRAPADAASASPLGRWINSVLDILETLWHNESIPPKLSHEEPLDGLILTVLSQNTNDRNRDAAFARLKQRFPSWEEAVAAGVDAVEDAVRPAGLAPTKARRILEIMEIIRSDFGSYSISALAERARDDIRGYLTALPGVGMKTASCVMMFDMNIPAFPVDTHIGRISRRIGFAPENMSADDISLLLEREVPEARYLGGHVNMIEHGRGLCMARKPSCGECPLVPLCEYGHAEARGKK